MLPVIRSRTASTSMSGAYSSLDSPRSTLEPTQRFERLDSVRDTDHVACGGFSIMSNSSMSLLGSSSQRDDNSEPIPSSSSFGPSAFGDRMTDGFPMPRSFSESGTGRQPSGPRSGQNGRYSNLNHYNHCPRRMGTSPGSLQAESTWETITPRVSVSASADSALPKPPVLSGRHEAQFASMPAESKGWLQVSAKEKQEKQDRIDKAAKLARQKAPTGIRTLGSRGRPSTTNEGYPTTGGSWGLPLAGADEEIPTLLPNGGRSAAAESARRAKKAAPVKGWGPGGMKSHQSGNARNFGGLNPEAEQQTLNDRLARNQAVLRGAGPDPNQVPEDLPAAGNVALGMLPYSSYSQNAANAPAGGWRHWQANIVFAPPPPRAQSAACHQQQLLAVNKMFSAGWAPPAPPVSEEPAVATAAPQTPAPTSPPATAQMQLQMLTAAAALANGAGSGHLLDLPIGDPKRSIPLL